MVEADFVQLVQNRERSNISLAIKGNLYENRLPLRIRTHNFLDTLIIFV